MSILKEELSAVENCKLQAACLEVELERLFECGTAVSSSYSKIEVGKVQSGAISGGGGSLEALVKIVCRSAEFNQLLTNMALIRVSEARKRLFDAHHKWRELEGPRDESLGEAE